MKHLDIGGELWFYLQALINMWVKLAESKMYSSLQMPEKEWKLETHLQVTGNYSIFWDYYDIVLIDLRC